MLITVLLIVALLSAMSLAAWFYIQCRALEAAVTELEYRYQKNPSYDCQLFMADIMAGQGLFKLERIERENLFFLRK